MRARARAGTTATPESDRAAFRTKKNTITTRADRARHLYRAERALARAPPPCSNTMLQGSGRGDGPDSRDCPLGLAAGVRRPPPPGGERPNAPAARLRGPGSLALVHRAERGVREGLRERALELLEPGAHALALLRGHPVVVQHAFQVVELVLHDARPPPPQP